MRLPHTSHEATRHVTWGHPTRHVRPTNTSHGATWHVTGGHPTRHMGPPDTSHNATRHVTWATRHVTCHFLNVSWCKLSSEKNYFAFFALLCKKKIATKTHCNIVTITQIIQISLKKTCQSQLRQSPFFIPFQKHLRSAESFAFELFSHFEGFAFCQNFSVVVVAHINPPVTGQRQTPTIGWSAYFSL